MGLTKSEIFTQKQNKIAVLAKALGHPARVAILQRLFSCADCCCTDLVSDIGLAQPTISQHLKELKNLGLIRGKTEGANVCYCIDARNWQKMKSVLHGFLEQDVTHPGNCC